MLHRPTWLKEVIFERLEAGAECWPMDPFTAEELSRWVGRIEEELSVRRGGYKVDEKPSVSPMQWLKPIFYQIILSCAHQDQWQVLEERLDKYRRFPGRDSREPTFILRGIMALTAHNRAMISPNERKRMAREMWHGFRNYVPPQRLNAFNRRYASAKIIPGFGEDTIVPDVYGEIVQERIKWEAFSSELETLRGWYPDAIEDAVEHIRLSPRKIDNLSIYQDDWEGVGDIMRLDEDGGDEWDE